MMYELHVSEDLGASYNQRRTASTIEEFDNDINKFEENGDVRWYVGKGDEIIKYGTYQQKYIDMVLDQKKSGQEMMVNTEDPMIRKVLEDQGIKVQNSADLLVMLGIPREQAESMMKQAEEKMKNMSPEEMEEVLGKMKQMEEDGTVKVYKDEK